MKYAQRKLIMLPAPIIFCKCHVIFAISLKSQTAKIMQVDMNLNCH